MLKNHSKLLAFVLLAAVFVAGGAVGGAMAGTWRGRGPETPGRRDRRENMSYVDRLQRDLALTPVQRDTISGILTSQQRHMEDIWSQVRPRMDSLRDDIRARIMAVLDSTQQVRYRELIARSDSIRAVRAQEGRHER